jgi:hypothetical protein
MWIPVNRATKVKMEPVDAAGKAWYERQFSGKFYFEPIKQDSPEPREAKRVKEILTDVPSGQPEDKK